MFCRNCGKEIADDSRVCGYCGAPIAGDWQRTEYRQTQNIYGEPKVQYSGGTETTFSNSSYQGTGNPGGTQYTQGSGNQNGYTQGTGYGTPQNMDGGATGMGIASMILGIVSLLISCCVSKWWLTIIVAACSIVLGILSIQKNSGGKEMATVGIVCSCVAIVMGLIVLALGAALVSAMVSFIYAMF